MKCVAGDTESTRFIRYGRGGNELLWLSNLVCSLSCIVRIFLLIFQLNVTFLQAKLF